MYSKRNAMLSCNGLKDWIIFQVMVGSHGENLENNTI